MKYTSAKIKTPFWFLIAYSYNLEFPKSQQSNIFSQILFQYKYHKYLVLLTIYHSPGLASRDPSARN